MSGGVGGAEGDEFFSLIDGVSTTTENFPFAAGGRSFNNRFSVTANTPITQTNTNVEPLNERLFMASITVRKVSFIPNLSEWGLLILALLLMLVGTLQLLQYSVYKEN